MSRRSVQLLFLALAFPMACTGGEPKDEGQPFSAGGAASTSAGLQYQAPEGWIEETPANAMRKGQFRLPKAEGDEADAELVITYFGPNQGGSVQANLDRWIGQFAGPEGSSAKESAEVSEKQVAGQTITILDVSGTYLASMGPMAAASPPKPNYRMLAAIVETPQGPWFFKLTGPKKTIEKWEASFDEFTDTIRVG